MSRRAYRFTAKFYDLFLEPFNRALRHIGLGLCPLPAEQRVLEIGCGTGANLALLARQSHTPFGIDLSPSMLAIARDKTNGAAKLIRANGAHLPFGDAVFDLSLAMLTLHEVDFPNRFPILKEMVRVLRPGGCLLLIDFHAGRLQFPKGWLKKGPIFFFEMAGGFRHFRNYRQFLSSGGIPPLLKDLAIRIEKEKIVGGGNFILIAVRKNTSGGSP